MNEINLLLAHNEDFQFISVNFKDNTKVYYYKTILLLEEGDEVIVDSPSAGMTVVTVTAVNCLPEYEGKYKWVVQKLDTTEYKRCQAIELALAAQLNSLRLARLRRGIEEELLLELGEDGVKGLVRL